MTSFESLIWLVDRLEAQSAGPLTLANVQSAGAEQSEIDAAIADDVLLVDFRERLLPDGNREPVVWCRLNRHHPVVRENTRE